MTAYEMRISEWSADVCSSDLRGSTYYAGNKKLLEEQGISLDNAATQKARSLQDHAKTVIYFADNRQALAILAIADTIKPTSKKAIETLQKNGIDVYMLTGDNRQTAAAVAKQAGLRHRSEEHTSELQSLMRISYAVFCLKKKKLKRINKRTRKDIVKQILEKKEYI